MLPSWIWPPSSNAYLRAILRCFQYHKLSINRRSRYMNGQIAKQNRNRPPKCCMFNLCALLIKLDRPMHSVLNHLFSNSRKYSLFVYSPINLLIGRSHGDPRVNGKALAALLIGFSIIEKRQPWILEAATSRNGLGYMNASSSLWRYIKSHQELPITTALPKHFFITLHCTNTFLWTKY